MSELFKNFIGGKWLAASSKQTFENRNPANRDDLIGVFPASTAEDVDAAVQAAKSAFSTWRLVPAPKRGELLYRVAELLRNLRVQFVQCFEMRHIGLDREHFLSHRRHRFIESLLAST